MSGVQVARSVPVHGVIDEYLRALVYLSGAALPARRPAARQRAVGRALTELWVRGHARGRRLVELHQYGRDGRLDEKRHQEQEHEQADDAQQYEERGQVEQHPLPELLQPFPLRLFTLLLFQLLLDRRRCRPVVIHQLIMARSRHRPLRFPAVRVLFAFPSRFFRFRFVRLFIIITIIQPEYSELKNKLSTRFTKFFFF